MVEIKRTDRSSPPFNSFARSEDDRYRLVYTKSKVYVNPTAYARDNIPGFVALVRRVSVSISPSAHLTLSVQFTGSIEPDLLIGLDS